MRARAAVFKGAQNQTLRNILEALPRLRTSGTNSLGMGRQYKPSGFHSGLGPSPRPHWPHQPLESQTPAINRSTKDPIHVSPRLPKAPSSPA